MDTDRRLIRFSATTGFSVVLEFGNIEEMKTYEEKIKNAGLQCKTIPDFNLNFDQADLSWICVARNVEPSLTWKTGSSWPHA